MTLRHLFVAALLLAAPTAASAAGPRPAPDLATLATAQPAAYAAYRRHHRHRRRHLAYRTPYWLVTRPRWPGCYDRYPFYCATPEYSRYAVRPRHPHRAVLRTMG